MPENEDDDQPSFVRPRLPEQLSEMEEMRSTNRLLVKFFKKRETTWAKALPWLQTLGPVAACLIYFYFGTNETLRSQSKELAELHIADAKKAALIETQAAKITALETASTRAGDSALQINKDLTELKAAQIAWNAMQNGIDKERIRDTTELRGLIREIQNHKP